MDVFVLIKCLGRQLHVCLYLLYASKFMVDSTAAHRTLVLQLVFCFSVQLALPPLVSV